MAISLAAAWLLVAGSARADEVASVRWQPAGRGANLSAPAPTLRRVLAPESRETPPGVARPPEKLPLRRASFQEPKDTLPVPRPNGQPAGNTAQFPPTREPVRGGATPFGTQGKLGEDEADFTIQTTLPGLERLTRRESEQQFFERMRQEARRRPGASRIYFPELQPLAPPITVPLIAYRDFAPMTTAVAPHYVCHRRLYFEQPNFERYGWSLGPMTPAVNLAIFYYDLALLPYHCWTDPCQKVECSAGKCLPGDPTPLWLYREKLSVTGLVGQTATVLGGFFIVN